MTVTCSSAQDSYPVENVLNGGENFWYSKYDPVEGQHYLQITFTNPEDIDGFIYRARPKESEAGKGNMGVLYKYRLELYDENNTLIVSRDDQIRTNTVILDRDRKTVELGQTYQKVKSMKLIFKSTIS